jgi:hypothetical protein
VGSACRRANSACCHETPLNHVALPVYVAYHTALSESPAPCEDRISLLRGNLTQDERPGPADSSMPGRIRATLYIGFSPIHCADGFLVHDERTSTHVMIIGRVGGKGSIIKSSTEQHIEMRRVLFSDRNVQCTGERAGRLSGIRERVLASHLSGRVVGTCIWSHS